VFDTPGRVLYIVPQCISLTQARIKTVPLAGIAEGPAVVAVKVGQADGRREHVMVPRGGATLHV